MKLLHVTAAALIVTAMLTGCNKQLIETKKIDYKSASKQTRPLEVPPDLAAPSGAERYSVPGDAGPATLSEYNQERGAQVPTNSGVLPRSDKAHIERANGQRWLVVEQSPEAIWPVVREFWQELGFIIAEESPETGIIETDWAENRAKIPEDMLRRAIGKVFDDVYSTPERDKFRTRLERGDKPGTTDIYITHRGVYEVYVEDANTRRAGRTVWQPRAPEPELEAEMLSRLMAKLGVKEQTQTTATGNVVAPPQVQAVLGKDAEGAPALLLKDDFDRAWRRVGLSLDRLGFAVQDRNRDDGLYYVRYLNPEEGTKKPSIWSRLTFWDSDAPKSKAEEYRVSVSEAAGGGTQVRVLNVEGKADRSEAASRILNVLREDLK